MQLLADWGAGIAKDSPLGEAPRRVAKCATIRDHKPEGESNCEMETWTRVVVVPPDQIED
jgi:hypothetical protein